MKVHISNKDSCEKSLNRGKFTRKFTSIDALKYSMEPKIISQKIFDIVEKSLEHNKINLNQLTPGIIRQILKDNRLNPMYSEQIYNHFTKSQQSIDLGEKEECVVCYDIFSSMIRLSCNHKFCDTCLFKMTLNEKLICPLCRNEQSYFPDVDISQEKMEQVLKYFRVNNSEFYDENGNLLKPFKSIISDILAKLRKI